MRLFRKLGWLLAAPAVAVVLWLGGASVVYGPNYVARVLVWQETDQHDYSHNFPQAELTASPEPRPFKFRPDPSAADRLATAFGVDDFVNLLERSSTEALVVIKNDNVVFEDYRMGSTRESLLTSFSVAKAVVAVLVGIAIDEGFISTVDAPITQYLPELADRDPRFQKITIRHLLSMSSGLEYQAFRWALFNGDDPLTSYFPDQRHISLSNTTYSRPPGEVFSYNKYHPQLLGLILERTTGMSVTEYTQTRLWNPLGMEFAGSWSLDSETSGFEKMEAGLNARAIDFAKFGRLFLARRETSSAVLPTEAWIKEVTTLISDQHRPDYYGSGWGETIYAGGQGYYGYFVYGRLRHNAPADVFAEGDRGQFIYVSPSKNLIIVRLGLEFGITSAEWIDGFFKFATNL